MMIQKLYKTIFMVTMIVGLSKLCNAGSHRIHGGNTLFDPEHGCTLEAGCHGDRCAVPLNEYSLAAFNNLHHQNRKINWDQVEKENEKIESENGYAVVNEANADVDEAELDSIMGRQAVTCPTYGHHM